MTRTRPALPGPPPQSPEVLEEAEEPLRPKEVLALGKEAGFKQGVIYRARKELEGTVVNTEGKRSPANRWALAEG